MYMAISKEGLDGSPTEVLMKHGDEQLTFNIALFDRVSFNGSFDIFAHINGFWGYQTPQIQDKIFGIYKEIKDTYDSVWDTAELTKRLYVLIASLYELHELSDLQHWISFHSDVVIPEGLREEFKESHETPGTRERTYLKDDYKMLVVLSVAMRVMIPIWGEFIARTKKETGTTFKEYYAFQLLAYSNIAKSEPMERLRVYVEHSLPAEKSKSAAIFGGISSEDFSTWVLALVAVRRLCIGDVRGTDPNSSLVTIIYKYIGQKVKSHDNSFIGMVKEKIVEGQGQEGENNLSKLEGYKIKQEIPAGDIAIISYYLLDAHALALRICPDINPDLVQASLESVRALETEQVWKAQTIIIQWALKSVIPPRGILHISKTLSLQAMAVTQAVLWHKGYFELAGLVSAIEQTNQDELQLGGTDSRARITKDQLEQLDVYYPYSRKPVGKQKVIKRINPAAEAIDSVAALFSEHDWRLTLPSSMLEKVTGNATNSRYSTPYDIKVKLANLAIAIADRTF